MTVREFAQALARELAARGVSRDEAIRHSAALVRTFTDEDMEEIEGYSSPEEFDELSNSLAALILSKHTRGTVKNDDADIASAPRGTQRTDGESHGANGNASGSGTAEDASSRENENGDAGTDGTKVSADGGFGTLSEADIPAASRRIAPAAAAASTGAMKTRAVNTGDTAMSADSSATKAFHITSTGAAAKNGSTAVEETVRISSPVTDATVVLKSPAAAPCADTTVAERSDMEKTIVGVSPAKESETQEIYLEESSPIIREKTVLTPRGKGFFWTITVLTSPLWICFAAAVLCVFGIATAAVCAFIAACLCLVCAEAAGGGIVALVGIIYGITRIITGNPAAGIFEIGIGIAAGGISLALGILTYNFAVLVLPKLLKQLISFEGYCLRRVPVIIDRFREECNRL